MPENIQFLPQKHLMQTDELVEIAKVFVGLGVRKIRLTGGEPLLRKDFQSIYQQIAALGVEMALSTNAVTLDGHLDFLVDQGLRSINISIDTLRPDRMAEITRRDVFQAVWDNIHRALDKGLKVKLNMVVMRGVNADEIPDFVRLTLDKPFHVRFIEYMPFDGNRWEWERVYPFAEILSGIQAEFPVTKLTDKPHATTKGYAVEGAKGTFSVISTVSEPFCAGCNRIRLTADGKVRNCLFATQELDLLAALRAGENIAPLIIREIQAKHAQLGGLPDFQDKEALASALSTRAMVKIGG